MAPAIQTQSQKPTRTLRTASPDQSLSVQEFLRSLRKWRRPLPAPTSLGAHSEAAEGPNLQRGASTCHEDFPYVHLGAISGPKLSDPPGSVPNKIHFQQVLSPFQEAETQRSSKPQGTDQRTISMKIPRALKTYSKKLKHALPLHMDKSTLSPTQFSTHEPRLPGGPFYDGLDNSTERPAFRESPINECAKKTKLVGSLKRKRQPVAANEEDRQGDHDEDLIEDDEHVEDDEVDSEIMRKEDTRKTRRKKRRAPVEGLSLVRTLNESLPSRTASFTNALVRISLGQHLFQVSIRQCD